jgi:hypothetical protein
MPKSEARSLDPDSIGAIGNRSAICRLTASVLITYRVVNHCQ